MNQHRSVGYRLFISMITILLSTILLTLLFGASVVENFYLHNKESQLLDTYEVLRHNLNTEKDKQNDAFYEAIYTAEKNNINILILSKKSNTATSVIYSSRDYDNRPPTHGKSPEKMFHLNPSLDFWREQVKEHPISLSDEPIIRNTKDNIFMELFGMVNHHTYIFLSTPREAVTLAANMAVKYYIVITFIAIILLSIATYIQSKHFSKPIKEIDSAAKRISNMDFSAPLSISTGDELESLSHSINIMAEKLQTYIQEMQQNQQLLQRDLQREEKTNAMRKEFIANVSHDFKTPLTLIQVYTEALAEKYPDDASLQECTSILLKETTRMTNLVTQLLQLSKLENHTAVLEISLFPIDEEIQTLLHDYSILLKQKNIHLTTDFSIDEDHLVWGDYHRIQNVLHNFIDNAIKYCPNEGRISLQSSITKDNKYRFTICNTVSNSLTDEDLENIFVSFHRLDKARSADGKSFGLGLAIVKAIMTLHNQPYGAYTLTQGDVCFWFELDCEVQKDEPEE